MSGVGVVSEEGWWGRPGLLTYILLTTLIATAIVYYFRRRRLVNLISKLPGPKGTPILGNALQMHVDNYELFQLLLSYCDYGEVMKVWMGPKPVVILSGPRAAQALLSTKKSIEKGLTYKFIEAWLSTGLLTSTGSKWHSRRKMLTPAFHFKILENFVDVFNQHSDKMVEKLRGKADGSLFNITQYITLCTLDIICETAMGCTVNAQDDKDSEYVKALYKVNASITERLAKLWQHFDFLYCLLGYAKERDAAIKVLHKVSRETIQERRKIYEQEKKKTKDFTYEDKLLGKRKQLTFLDLLLEASEGDNGLCDEDIREEVDTFMFEGHDTTATAINWFLYVLGRHPEIQAHVHEELDSIFGDSERPVTMADLREMKYFEMCIKETLRLYPSVPAISRCLTNDLIIGDTVLPTGTNVGLMIYKIHRDPTQFPEPEKFDPDRFLPENVTKRHPYAFIPFSAGPRNCIGQKFAMMEEKVVLGNVLRQFRVESDTPMEDIQLLWEVVLRPRYGNFIRLIPRRP